MTDNKSPMAGAKCELVMLITKELYEMHRYFTKRYRENYDNEL